MASKIYVQHCNALNFLKLTAAEVKKMIEAYEDDSDVSGMCCEWFAKFKKADF